jgi:UDP-3-O-[3-hydroxymyristoyl] glucosamine N-acyltransferase
MVLYGASGHAKVIIDILEKRDIEISHIIDDNNEIVSLNNYSVQNNNIGIGEASLIISIGNNIIRKEISEKLKVHNFGQAIHPSLVIDKTSKILEGTVVMANVVINSSVSIGKHCIINTNAVIEHDC